MKKAGYIDDWFRVSHLLPARFVSPYWQTHTCLKAIKTSVCTLSCRPLLLLSCRHLHLCMRTSRISLIAGQGHFQGLPAIHLSANLLVLSNQCRKDQVILKDQKYILCNMERKIRVVYLPCYIKDSTNISASESNGKSTSAAKQNNSSDPLLYCGFNQQQ